jgi:hypothetical protein
MPDWPFRTLWIAHALLLAYAFYRLDRYQVGRGRLWVLPLGVLVGIMLGPLAWILYVINRVSNRPAD